MKKLVLIFSLISTSAFAQAPQIVPYTITPKEHTDLMNYLGEQPAKFSVPLMQALGALAQKAIDEKAAKDKEEKKEEKK
jgi:hypothetical protein